MDVPQTPTEQTSSDEKSCCKKTKEVIEYISKAVPISGNIYCFECNSILKK